MKRGRRSIFVIFLSVLLVFQIIAFSYLVSPLISGFFIKETGRVAEDKSDVALEVGGVLNVKELCFEGGRCIKSAGEMKGECDDGTISENCSLNKPLYCTKNRSLINLCGTCGCPGEKVCMKSELCEEPKAQKILYSGSHKTKINMLVIGEGFSDEVFYPLVSTLFSDWGLFSIQPYKDNKSSFNVWALNTQGIGVPYLEVECSYDNFTKAVTREQINSFIDKTKEENGLTFIQNTIFLTSRKSEWPRASLVKGAGGYAIIPIGCITNYLYPNEAENVGNKLVLNHEVGHIFGLADEYIDTSGKSQKLQVEGANCAHNTEEAVKLWDNFFNQGEGTLKTGYYEGCFLQDAIRPVENGIMNENGYLYISKNEYERAYGEYEISIIEKNIENIITKKEALSKK